MRIKNLLNDKRFILPVLITILSASMSFTPQTPESAALASTSAPDKDGVVTSFEYLGDCDKTKSYSCRVKITATKDGEKSESIYTLRREKTDKLVQEQTEASGALADLLNEHGGENSTEPKDQVNEVDKNLVYYNIVAKNEECDCLPVIYSLEPLNLQNKNTATFIQRFSSMFDSPIASLKQAEANKVLDKIAQKAEDKKEKKRQDRIAKCEIDESGESLKKLGRETDRLECLNEKMWDLDDETDMLTYFNKNIRGLLNKFLTSSNPDLRERAFQTLSDIGAEVEGHSELSYQILAMTRGVQAMNYVLELAQQSASGDSTTRQLNNMKIDNTIGHLKFLVQATSGIATNSKARSEGNQWIQRVETIAKNAIQQPDVVARSYFNTDMEFGNYDDNLGLPLINDFNQSGNPVVAPPTIGSGRLQRNNRYNFGTIPGLDQSINLNSTVTSSSQFGINNSLLNTSNSPRSQRRSNLLSSSLPLNNSSSRTAPMVRR